MMKKIIIILIIFVGAFFVVRIGLNKSKDKDNAVTYYSQAYQAWNEGKKEAAADLVREGSTKEYYQPKSDDPMGFSEAEMASWARKLINMGNFEGAISSNYTTAREIARYLCSQENEADCWVAAKLGEDIGGEKYSIITQLVGITIARNSYDNLLKLYESQDKTKKIAEVRGKLDNLQARIAGTKRQAAAAENQ